MGFLNWEKKDDIILSLLQDFVIPSNGQGDTLFPLVLEIDDSLDIKRKAGINCQRDFHNRLRINSIVLFFGKAVMRHVNKLNFETHTCMFKKTGTWTTTVIIIVIVIISGMVIVVIIINMTPPIIIITGVTIATQTRSIYMDRFLLLALNGILHRLITGN